MALGEELVTNGGFGSDSDWTLDTPPFSIAGGVLVVDGTAGGTVTQDIAVVNGTAYQLEFTISGYIKGDLIPSVGGRYGIIRRENGTFIETVTSGIQANVRFITGQSKFEGNVDDVSVKEMIGTTQGFVG